MHKNQKPCRNPTVVKMKFAQNFLINVTRTFSAVVFLQYLIWKFFMRISAYFALAWHHIWYNMCSMIHIILKCIVQVSFNIISWIKNENVLSESNKKKIRKEESYNCIWECLQLSNVSQFFSRKFSWEARDTYFIFKMVLILTKLM